MNSVNQSIARPAQAPACGSLSDRIKATAQSGIEALASNHIMKASLQKLAPQQLTVQLFGADQQEALALLTPRWTTEGRRQNADSNYAALSLAREVETMSSAGPLFSMQARTLRNLRAHFVPHAADLDQLRTDFAVRLHAGRGLHASLRTSSDPRLYNQTYFLFCLCELLDKLDDCARSDACGVSLLDPNGSSTSTAAVTVVACLAGAGLYLLLRRA